MPEYRSAGDALRADKIVAEAQSIDRIIVTKRTSRHRGQFITLRGNAYCVIEIPLKVVLEKKK